MGAKRYRRGWRGMNFASGYDITSPLEMYVTKIIADDYYDEIRLAA